MIPLNPVIPHRPLRVMSFTHLADWLLFSRSSRTAKLIIHSCTFQSQHDFIGVLLQVRWRAQLDRWRACEWPLQHNARCPQHMAPRRRDRKLHFRSDASLNGTPDDSHTMFDSVVMQTSISLKSKAHKAFWVTVLFSFHAVLFNFDAVFPTVIVRITQTFHACHAAKTLSHDKNIKLIRLILQVCPRKWPQNSKKFPFCSFSDVLRLCGAFTDSCYTR